MVRILDEPGTRTSEPLLIGSLLRTPLATAPRQQIVYRDVARYDYLTLRVRIAKLARVLTELGIEEGDTVAVMDWDSHRYLECYFAIPMMGAVLMTVNLRLSADQIAYTLQRANARVVLVHHDFVPLLTALAAQLPLVTHAVLLEPEADDVCPFRSQRLDYEALLMAADADFVFREFDERAVATTFFTTGTTGLPKAVCFTHRQIMIHTLAVLGALASPQHGQSFRQGDVYMPMTPMFHVHAWGLPYVATLLGVKQVYPGRYVPARLLALREREGVSYSHCVPTILQMLLEAPESAQTDLRGWKITVGGAALGQSLARAALARGIDVFAAYGMSETCPFLTAARLTDDDGHDEDANEIAQRCRTGLPAPLVELRIVDENMQDVPHDGEAMGELVARAPWLTSGYVGDRDATVELWHGGYLHTRDIATIDSQGVVQLRDRLKDVIKSGGEWVSSLLLEDLIGRHENVAEVAVIGVADERWGERPVAVVVRRTAAANHIDADALRQHLEAFVQTGQIPKYAVPERFDFVNAIVKTSVGKFDKKKLRAMLESSGPVLRSGDDF
ncbi:MAG TPA: fatty acid--CoA ligase [Steroidobacteraceae bacterium]|nr:fatty acid--CoA ligase [Steroidobacteraceae bacterium]HRX89469.1 fatty acid--CoA ligase [Steroidobacteraceae bacterium]